MQFAINVPNFGGFGAATYPHLGSGSLAFQETFSTGSTLGWHLSPQGFLSGNATR
jgi:hypothetical protein